MRLEILKDLLFQFIKTVVYGKTNIQQEIFGEKVLCIECSCVAIRTSGEISWKAY